LAYPAQLDRKRERVRRAFAPYANLGPRIAEVWAAEPFLAYRRRAKLIVGWSAENGGTPAIGLYADGHEVVDIPRCRVLSPLLLGFTGALRELLRDPSPAAGACLVAEGAGGRLCGFDLREVTGDRAGLLVTVILRAGRPVAGAEQSAVAAALRAKSDAVLGIAVNYREAGNPQVLGAHTETIWGASFVGDRSGASFEVATFGSFAQAHAGQSAKIGEHVAHHVAGMRPEGILRVLDLYAGSGTRSLSFAREGAKVTLVEAFPAAAECARRAATELGLEAVDVRTADAARALRDLAAERASFDLVIANPPRRGLAPAARQAVAALEPPAIAYVSCDPDTLARDLAHLSWLGYRAETVQPVDMIPLTDQVETVAVLLRGARPDPRTLFEDDDLHIVEKPAHLPATPPRPGHRLLWAAAEQASGLALWSKQPATFALFQKALRTPEARMRHLALAKGSSHKKGRLGDRARYERMSPGGGHSFLNLTTTQAATQTLIVCQLARIGHPLIGDPRSGHAPTNRHFEEKYALDRLFLHGSRLELEHPKTKAPLTVDLPLPGDLALVLERLGYLASMSRNEW
jgi:23S rRNA (uracil1939-C5)-methyltransferase